MTKNCSIFFLSLVFALPMYPIEIVWTVGGNEVVDNALIKELLQDPSLERLKYIDQSGPLYYFGLAPKFSRYDHSVGVWALLKRAGVTLEEQVAGLEHDASHTVFSHVADVLFEHSGEHSYQDMIHLDSLKKMNVDVITKRWDISLEKLNPDRIEYRALERPLPHLCADRIQYNIHTGIILNIISIQDAIAIVEDLIFKDGQWYFKNITIAQKFARLPLYCTQVLWDSPWNCIMNHYFADMLNHALKIELISLDDIHFGTDANILEKLIKSDDVNIQKIMKKCHNVHYSFTIVKYGKGTINLNPKFRGVDPLVLVDSTCVPLSTLDPVFKEEFERVKEWCLEGYGIIIHDTL
jgi:HD superfamily phosphohydrolase